MNQEPGLIERLGVLSKEAKVSSTCVPQMSKLWLVHRARSYARLSSLENRLGKRLAT